MSGIVAVYCLDGRPAVRAMLDAARYRGPDGLDSWVDGPVALGHAMLRTTPEAVGESQPLVDAHAGLAITMDGRVENRDELKELLEREGLRLAGNTDAEIALHAYQCWGEAAPAKILGDFAFALWDAGKRQLFCARDYASVQPLFYFRGERTFICASELQQILIDPAVPREPNEQVIGVYLSGMLMDRRSLFIATCASSKAAARSSCAPTGSIAASTSISIRRRKSATAPTPNTPSTSSRCSKRRCAADCATSTESRRS